MSAEIEQTPAKHRGLLGSSAIVGAMTMLSRVLGLLRDIVIARLFGAGESADAFFIAFRIPQFLRRLFAEGAFAQAFVPVLSEYRQTREANGEFAAVQALVNAVCGVLGGVLAIVTGVIVMAAPLVAMVFAPGFVNQPEKFALTVDLLRITFPYLLFISLTAFAGSILNSYDKFLVPALTPVLLNLSLIGFALWLSPQLSEPVFALAWAVLFAGLAQLLFQLPFLSQLNLLPRPKWDMRHPGVRRIMTLMLPALFGVSVSQINLLLDTVLASFLPEGSVSWLYYSDRLAELPLGVFGIAIATVLLPSLSRLYPQLQGDIGAEAVANFRRTLDWALRCVVVIAVPAMAALVVLAEPILFLLFQYGSMLPGDVAMASYSLRAYALGLLAFMAIKVLATGYFARQDTKTPVKIGIIAMVANMALNLVFVSLLHLQWQLGHAGLALATSASAWLNAGLLFRGLQRSPVLAPNREALLGRLFWRAVVIVILCTALMVGVLLFLLSGQADWAVLGAWQRAIDVGQLCAAGLVTYLAGLWLCGLRMHDFRVH